MFCKERKTDLGRMGEFGVVMGMVGMVVFMVSTMRW